MQTVKIQSINRTPYVEAFVADKPISGIVSVDYNQSADTVPQFTFEVRGFPNIEIDNADIRFRFTPETIEDAARVILHSFLADKELYNAFVASIASALKEVPTGTGIYDVAQAVADRIIGREDFQIL